MATTPGAGVYDLPSEMLLSIFATLSLEEMVLCAGMCERWHSLVTESPHLWRGRRYASEAAPRLCAETRALLHALPPLLELVVETSDSFRLDLIYPRLLLSLPYIGVIKDCPRMSCVSLTSSVEIAGDIMSYRSTLHFEALRRLCVVKLHSVNAWVLPIYDADNVVGAALRLCPNLTHLSISTDLLSADSLDRVKRLCQLRSLEIHSLGLARLSFLRHCAGSLEQLQLVDCASLSSPEFAQLRQLQKLRRLRIADCRFAQEDLAAALGGLVALELLELNRCAVVRDLSPLQACVHLRYLWVTCSPALLVATPCGELLRLQLHNLRVPTAVDERSDRAACVAVAAAHLVAALDKLRQMGLADVCLDYLAPLHTCSQLRHCCCEFVPEPDQPGLLNTRVNIIMIADAEVAARHVGGPSTHY